MAAAFKSIPNKGLAKTNYCPCSKSALLGSMLVRGSIVAFKMKAIPYTQVVGNRLSKSPYSLNTTPSTAQRQQETLDPKS